MLHSMNTALLACAVISGACALGSVLGGYGWIVNERRKMLSRGEQSTEDISWFGDMLLPGNPLVILNEIKLLPHTARAAAALWRANHGFKAYLVLAVISTVTLCVSLWFLL